MNLLLSLIRAFEGLRLSAYRCPAGIWTIGYGSTGAGIGPGLVWTLEQAEARLLVDAAAFWGKASTLCPGLSEARTAALADFAYNLGSTRLAGSTLRRRANAGDIPGAAEEFGKWVHAAGRKLPGLVLRRDAERRLFLTP